MAHRLMPESARIAYSPQVGGQVTYRRVRESVLAVRESLLAVRKSILAVRNSAASHTEVAHLATCASTDRFVLDDESRYGRTTCRRATEAGKEQ
jgi:hypothetical protein